VLFYLVGFTIHIWIGIWLRSSISLEPWTRRENSHLWGK